jgi:nitroreductase
MNSPWEPIIQTALRTPSPHNTQPWRLRIRDDRRATLFMERARTLPDEDTTGHFLRCAMGMFLESLRIVSANAGLTLQYTLIHDDLPSPFIRFAEMELNGFSEASQYPDSLFQIRKTSRLPSTGVRIDPTLTALLKQTGEQHGHRYYQLDDPALIEAIVLENIRAASHDLNVPAYHHEIAKWLRCSDQESRAKADGLDYRCMRTPPILLKLMRQWPQIMCWPLTRGLIRRMFRSQLGKVSHIGVISGPFFGDAAAVSAGKFLMQFWLELSRQKLFIHPFGNLVTNSEAKMRIRELTSIDDVWLIFRIGYTDEPPQSFRRPLNKVLIHD